MMLVQVEVAEPAIDVRQELAHAGMAGTVSWLLGGMFPAYAKIYYPFLEITTGDRARDESRQRLNAMLLGIAEPDTAVTRLKASEVASRLGLAFPPEFNRYSIPRSKWNMLVFPIGGHVPLHYARMFSDILESTGMQQVCYFRWPAIVAPQPGLDTIYRGTVGDMIEFVNAGMGRGLMTPEEWVAIDHSWALNTGDLDFIFAALGGDEALIDAVVRSQWWEAVRVDGTLRVDMNADRVNRPLEP